MSGLFSTQSRPPLYYYSTRHPAFGIGHGTDRAIGSPVDCPLSPVAPIGDNSPVRPDRLMGDCFNADRLASLRACRMPAQSMCRSNRKRETRMPSCCPKRTRPWTLLSVLVLTVGGVGARAGGDGERSSAPEKGPGVESIRSAVA